MKTVIILLDILFLCCAFYGIINSISEKDYNESIAWGCAFIWCLNCFLKNIKD